MSVKKILAFVLALVLVCSLIPAVAAAETSATVDFTSTTQRTDYSTDAQVWSNDGLTITNNKDASTSNVGDYSNPARFYKSSTVIIAYPSMTKIEINAAGLAAKYVTPWTDTLTAAGLAFTNEGDVITVTLAEAVDSLTLAPLTAQARAYSITVYGGGEVTPTTPTEPEATEPTTPAGDAEYVTAPVAGTAYKFGMVQEGVSTTDVYYLKGGMSGYYMATSKNVEEALNVYLEETTGGYYLRTEAGDYINMVVSGTYVNGAYEAAASTVYTYDEETDTIVATVNDTLYRFGTRSDKTYTTVGPVKVEMDNYFCRFYAAEASTDPTEPEATEPEATEPTTPAGDAEYVTAPVAGTAYKFGMVQEGVSTTDVYYLKGGMSGYYMATSKNVEEALNVYLEETTGGYYLRTEAGDYINMVVSGTYVNGAYEAAASTVYTYDEETDTIVATVNDTLYRFGTRSDKTYTTVGPVKVEMDNYFCRFYAAEASTDPTEPEVTEPTTPVEPETVTIAEALALGTAQAENTYTAVEYKVTGVITEVESTTYGNMYITDGTDTLYIYGVYDVTGEIRYDAMEVKPTAGDTVTICGALGNYYGVPQIKNGRVVEHTIGEPPATEPADPNSATYNFPDYVVEGELGGGECSRDLDENVNLYISSGWFTTQARIYKNAYGVISSKVAMESIVVNMAANKAGNYTFPVSVSDDGETWTVLYAEVAYTGDYTDITIELPEGCKYVKFETPNAQIRMKSMTVNFAVEEGLAGDIDGNGSVTNDDVIALMWNVLFPDQYPLEGDVDLNNDNVVTNDDVIALMWYVLFPEQYPLPL